MRVLMPQGEPVNFDGIERKFLFNINVIDEIQEHYDMNIGDVLSMIFTNDKDKKRNSYDVLCYVITVLANEDTRIYNKTSKKKREKITEEQLKETLTHVTANQLAVSVYKAFTGAITSGEDDDNPNQTSE